ncbi:MAG: hypothetical protein JEZ01_21250 [Labilibaculum sp.]|nr:hypothetical protein [Labilibaculum sp.]MBI9060308.1 hypothetical protein [Labilibaculum sp.]
MANIDDFNNLKPELEAIKKEDIQNPNMPVDTAIQEAEDTYYWSNIDREKLATAGLDLAIIDSILARTAALQYCQSAWMKEYDNKAEAEKQWKELSPLAFALRDELVHFCRFAYRNNPALIKQVKRIAEGHTNADMIQDLSDLALLGKTNPEGLTTVGLDLTKLDTAENYAESLGLLLAKVNGSRSTNSKPAKDMRDRAFTYLKQGVDAIRATGQFVFWKDEEKAKHYASAYFRDSRSKNKVDAEIVE